jgi:hypothetical protein
VQRKSHKGRAVDAILTTNSHLKQRVAESIKAVTIVVSITRWDRGGVKKKEM